MSHHFIETLFFIVGIAVFLYAQNVNVIPAKVPEIRMPGSGYWICGWSDFCF